MQNNFSLPRLQAKFRYGRSSLKVTNHHDNFFTESFSDLENAADFIQSTFPKEILSHLDLASLKLDNNSYTDEKLKEFFADMVYDCVYDNSLPIKISILMEHKSFVPDTPHIQLLKYMLGIWESEEKTEAAFTTRYPGYRFSWKRSMENKNIF
ncbi:MAG: hypothetical protein CVV50_03335 [Spirochaetae bacterium HGW-Spirochaetae-6]|nr:MAG: hypothetical protein CVV50_03335 [Spirochaetae bacterium HGW-Spirochaetae-6]